MYKTKGFFLGNLNQQQTPFTDLNHNASAYHKHKFIAVKATISTKYGHTDGQLRMYGRHFAPRNVTELNFLCTYG